MSNAALTMSDEVAGALLESPYANDIYNALGNIARNDDPVTFEIFRAANPQLEANAEYERLVKIFEDYFNDMHRMPQTDAERAKIQMGFVADVMEPNGFQPNGKRYLDQSARYLVEGVESDWQGVETLSVK